MNEFQAKRVKREFREKISATPSEIFPLLCPVREYDWLDGWSCEMIYSDSGVVENNCIFTSSFPAGDKQTWITTSHDAENYSKEFLVINPDSRVMRFGVSLRDCGNSTTEAHWTMLITALNEQGNTLVEGYTEEVHNNVMGMLAQSLKHYCETGSKLKLHGHS